jgi:membrane-bound lytic murein transglycosylase B
MFGEMDAGRLYPRAAVACLAVLLAFALAATSAAAQDEPLHGADFTLETPTDEWVDPATTLGFTDDELEPVPELDLTQLAASPILATGVESIVVEEDTLGVHLDQHLRAHQVAATVQRQIDDTSSEIAELRPRVAELNDDITAELDNEARLTFEIDRINAAIAEFAVRAFIGEDDDLETAFSEAISDVGETKVLSDGVRDAQFEDIDAKEVEREQRRRHRLDLETERDRIRSTIDGLQADRLEQLADLRWVEELIETTAVEHQRHLHRRLTDIVDGADFQLVALNAYVIAARTIGEEAPECAIEWWMLAGIGSIESFHGRFGDSELDHNGFTTEPIYGPALDGRILDGEEFLTAGTEIPEATGKTEDLPVADAAAAVDPAVADAETSAADPAAAAVAPDGTDPEAEVPVIRRLALIEDTDGGLLDDDTTYDRAVGPMQFIPQTWSTQEVDADGDGEMNPQNIYDAALASANYLCASTTSMATIEGQQQAYYAYNHDDAYTEAVIAASERYRELFTFPEPPEVSDAAELSSALAGDTDAPAQPTHWLGIGAFDAEAPAAITLDLELDLPNW